MKIALLGVENSHAATFSELVRTDERFKDIEIAGLYSYDRAACEKIVNAGTNAKIADRPDEFVGTVDGVMITARHGEHHYEYALPYIRAGVPLFIDKPFTIDPDHAKEMIALAKEYGAKIVGGSCFQFLKELEPLSALVKAGKVCGGSVTAPIDMVNPYGNFYFYAQHLTAILCKVFGDDIKSVVAVCRDETKNHVDVVFEYDTFSVTAQYYNCYTYTASVITETETRFLNISDYGYTFAEELIDFRELVNTGVMPHSYEDLIKPVFLLRAIEESFHTGRRVEVTA